MAEKKNDDAIDRICSTLECTMCRILPTSSPIYRCNIGHIVCNVCYLTVTTCSVCHAELGDQRCLVSEEILHHLRDNVSGNEVLRKENGETNQCKNSDVSNSLWYGVSIAAGATASITLAPALLSSVGSAASGIAAKSLASGVRNLLYEGALTGLVTLAQSAATDGFGTAGTLAAGTIGAALAAASTKVAHCFVKEFTSHLKKGITTEGQNNGIRKRSKRRTVPPKIKVENTDSDHPETVIIDSSDEDSS